MFRSFYDLSSLFLKLMFYCCSYDVKYVALECLWLGVCCFIIFCISLHFYFVSQVFADKGWIVHMIITPTSLYYKSGELNL